jgi:hypothetical protein
LKKLDYLTISQLQVLHDLGSARNTSRVLKDMSEYVTHFREGEAVYYLTKEGRDLVGATKIRKKTSTARHYIMRNSIYIAYGNPSSWKNEVKLEVPNQIKIISDALFIRDGRYHLVEVDNIQKMNANRAKITKYRKLLEYGVFEKPPVFVWMTTTEYRRKQLTKLCEGLDAKIFIVSDFH